MSLVSMLIFHSHLGSVILDTVTPPTSTAPTPPSAPVALPASSTTANPSWPRKTAGQTISNTSERIKKRRYIRLFLSEYNTSTTGWKTPPACSDPIGHEHTRIFTAQHRDADFSVMTNWFVCITYPACMRIIYSVESYRNIGGVWEEDELFVFVVYVLYLFRSSFY